MKQIPWLTESTLREVHEESRFKLIADPTAEGGVRQIGGNINIGSLALSAERQASYDDWVRQNAQSPEEFEDLI